MLLTGTLVRALAAAVPVSLGGDRPTGAHLLEPRSDSWLEGMSREEPTWCTRWG